MSFFYIHAFSVEPIDPESRIAWEVVEGVDVVLHDPLNPWISASAARSQGIGSMGCAKLRGFVAHVPGAEIYRTQAGFVGVVVEAVR